MRQRLQELQQGDLSSAQRQEELDQLIRDYHHILSLQNSWLDWQKPQTVDSAALLLERMIFEQAAVIASTEPGREQLLRNAPQELALDPNQPRYDPPLRGPVAGRGSEPRPSTPSTAVESRTTASQSQAPLPALEPEPEHVEEQRVSVGSEAKVAVLADEKTTTDMHEDNTILRDVTDETGQLVLFGKVRLWVGGALQLDAYWGDGLFTFGDGGGSDSKSYVRRGEGILRASVFEQAETKVQFDFDSREFRDLYWRLLSKSNSSSLTIGNQKEPIGQDYLVGSKFTTALEPSAPSSAFGSFRSTGIRYSGWTTLESGGSPLQLWGDSRTHVTTSIGLFGEDIENTNDTDWAVTGRVSVGGRRTQEKGFHLAAAASYRQGEYDRIAPRPGLQDINRIPLAEQQADTQALFALEGLYGNGSLHSQAELYYSDYSGGTEDAQGWGGYGQVGWLFGGHQRIYHPDWGIWGPIHAGKAQVFEIFGRVSYTRGNDDINSSNELTLVTVGGNWYYRQLRLSTNLILANTKRDIFTENQGNALALRLQYIF